MLNNPKLKSTKPTQREWVLAQVKEHGYITRNQCLRNYITRLTSIINLLKKEGYQFESKYVDVETFWGKGKDYRYTLVTPRPRVQKELF